MQKFFSDQWLWGPYKLQRLEDVYVCVYVCVCVCVLVKRCRNSD